MEHGSLRNQLVVLREMENGSFHGIKIYMLTLIFIMLTITAWLFIIIFDVEAYWTNDILHISASIAVATVLILIAIMDMASIVLSAKLQWMLTILLIAAMTLWSLTIIASATILEFFVIGFSVLSLMTILSAVGSKLSLNFVAIYASFLTIWWLVSLILLILMVFVLVFTQERSLGIYLMAVIFYPFFIGFMLFESMLISRGRVPSKLLKDCLVPARTAYFQFVMIFMISLLVWREWQV